MYKNTWILTLFKPNTLLTMDWRHVVILIRYARIRNIFYAETAKMRSSSACVLFCFFFRVFFFVVSVFVFWDRSYAYLINAAVSTILYTYDAVLISNLNTNSWKPFVHDQRQLNKIVKLNKVQVEGKLWWFFNEVYFVTDEHQSCPRTHKQAIVCLHLFCVQENFFSCLHQLSKVNGWIKFVTNWYTFAWHKTVVILSI